MISTNDYVAKIGLPRDWKEVHLQNYISEILEKRGYQTKLEVPVNGGRADIVSNWAGGSIIEVKKFLDRENILQASGQVQAYGHGNQRKLFIMGFLPSDSRAIEPALKAAQMVECNPRIEVVFLNVAESWAPVAVGEHVSQYTAALVSENLQRLFGFILRRVPTSSVPKLDGVMGRMARLAFQHPLIVLVVFMLGVAVVQNQMRDTYRRDTYQQQSNSFGKTIQSWRRK